ncbi:hypothetical protein [Algoriphagus sp. AGSA1]|nr:hypothetical protein [Algoriphagus sp. AGSA1]
MNDNLASHFNGWYKGNRMISKNAVGMNDVGLFKPDYALGFVM